ncbi:MAG: hypothetical protein EAX86_07425 [Candidatus Heimdallarchaeota archaeon]|nr:hypothetical protein [Candidatus Heimdallarchaeota archaeon]
MKPLKAFLLSLFLCLIISSFLFETNDFSSSQNFLEPPSSLLIMPKTIQDDNNTFFLTDSISQSNEFTNESHTHNWILQDLNRGQLVYFSIIPRSGINVSLYNPSNIKLDNEDVQIIHPSKYLGMWQVSIVGDWRIQLDDIRPDKSENYSYSILATIPSSGFNEVSALAIDESQFQANFSIDHETHYWKVSLDENQNSTLSLREITPAVLFEAKITIYRELYPQNPVLTETEISGSFNYSWNPSVSDQYFIKIRHKPADTSPIGIYNISITSEGFGYSFETAIELPYNHTLSIRQVQGFTPRRVYFFWFYVNTSRSDVFIHVFGPNTTDAKILEFATVEIFDEGKQNSNPLYTGYEALQTIDKNFEILLDAVDSGLYYLVISPESSSVGQFFVHFDYHIPPLFAWNVLGSIITFITIIAFPLYLVYLDTQGKLYRIHGPVSQWEFSLSLKETFKFIKYSFRGVFSIKEVPSESILVRIPSVPFRTYALLNFIESSENETLIVSKRILRRIEWVLFPFLGLLILNFVNLISLILFSDFLLPYYLPNVATAFFILAAPTILLLIPVIFINLSSYLSYSQVIDRINFVVHDYQEKVDNEVPSSILEPEQAEKNINYVRVLWNQAKHAFKEDNFELFVIKADAAVKNLLSTRYQQIVSSSGQLKPIFQLQVHELRKRGFDLPSDKKITHFRNLRNRIVHSSVTLDEKESVDCFAFYSTFITRLGLRPT